MVGTSLPPTPNLDVKHPLLIVFDLDYTLWDCGGTWCDCLSPPFSMKDGQPVDRTSRVITLYNDVLAILDRCDELSIPMAVASRTQTPDWAAQLLEMLTIRHRFAYEEMYPTTKLQHFAALQADSEIDPRGMLFFDDEMRNIDEVSTLGVTCIYVDDGMSHEVFNHGMSEFGGAIL